MDLTSILAQIVGGAVGGTAGGKILKDSISVRSET